MFLTERCSAGTLFTFLDQRFFKPFEIDFAESLSEDVTSALKLWIVLVIIISCGSAFVPNYLYISLAIVVLSIGTLSLLRILAGSRHLQWEKLAIVYSSMLIMMAPCTDQLNVTMHWVGAAESSDLPKTSAIASLRTVLFFCGSLMIPVRIHLAVTLLAAAAASLLYWKYLLEFSGGPSMGIEESDVTALGCLLVVIVSGWKREHALRHRFREEDQERMRDRDRHLLEMQGLQASASAFENAALLLCDIIVEIDEERKIADQPQNFATFFEEPASQQPVLELIAPADRERIEALLKSTKEAGMRRPVCTTVMVQKPSGMMLSSDLLVFSTSQERSVLGFHFKAREEAAKAERISQQQSQQQDSHHSHRSDMSSMLTYSLSSRSTAPSSLRRQAEAEALEAGSRASTANSATAPSHAQSIVTAMLHEQRGATQASPRAGLPPLPKAGGNTTREAEVQTERPPMEDKEMNTVGTEARSEARAEATRAKPHTKPPPMPGSSPRRLTPSMGIADAADNMSDTASMRSSNSQRSSVSMRSSASFQNDEDRVRAGHCAAVLMAIEMCKVKKRTCCHFHGSAALVAKLAKKMRNGPCDQRWRPNSGWQCPSCFCMLSSEPDVCIVCEVPNPARQCSVSLAL